MRLACPTVTRAVLRTSAALVCTAALLVLPQAVGAHPDADSDCDGETLGVVADRADWAAAELVDGCSTLTV